MIHVLNASPLIVLAKAELLGAILAIPDYKTLIPRAVADEINCCDDRTDPALIWLQSSLAANYLEDSPTIPESVIAWGLGAGESSVISLAQILPNATAVLDDLAARRCAESLGLPVTGTLGLVLKAKKTGNIKSVAKALDSIVAAGLFISERHLLEICQRAGETYPWTE